MPQPKRGANKKKASKAEGAADENGDAAPDLTSTLTKSMKSDTKDKLASTLN